MRRKHILEERVQTVREHLENRKSFSELSETYDVTIQVVRNWVKRYQEMGVAGLEGRQGKRLAFQTRHGRRKRRYGSKRPVWNGKTIYLKMELDLLKK